MCLKSYKMLCSHESIKKCKVYMTLFCMFLLRYSNNNQIL